MKLKEHIKRILREEVERKYLKPSPNSEKLINDILNKLFSGADMYYDKVSNVRHDFEFCKNGKQIATFIIYLDNDDEAWEDKRSSTERNFRKGMLRIYSETINDILKHIPIRRNYLKHIIDEWFEETYLDMINKKMGRNDITIDTIDELPNRPDVCAPPQTKPDEITDEEMIKYIMKNTLYRREDIEKNESEEPGWIENLYLKKLRNEKHDELRWRD